MLKQYDRQTTCLCLIFNVKNVFTQKKMYKVEPVIGYAHFWVMLTGLYLTLLTIVL